MKNIERNDNVRVRALGQAPRYQEKRKRHSNRPVALIGVTVCIVMVIVFNAAKVTMGALALANAPTVCYLVMTVLLFTPSLLRRTYANEMY